MLSTGRTGRNDSAGPAMTQQTPPPYLSSAIGDGPATTLGDIRPSEPPKTELGNKKTKKSPRRATKRHGLTAAQVAARQQPQAPGCALAAPRPALGIPIAGKRRDGRTAVLQNINLARNRIDKAGPVARTTRPGRLALGTPRASQALARAPGLNAYGIAHSRRLAEEQSAATGTRARELATHEFEGDSE